MTRDELIEKVATMLADYDGKDMAFSESIINTIYDALKEPSREMIKVGKEARWNSPVRSADCVTEIWKAMLSVSSLNSGVEK